MTLYLVSTCTWVLFLWYLKNWKEFKIVDTFFKSNTNYFSSTRNYARLSSSHSSLSSIFLTTTGFSVIVDISVSKIWLKKMKTLAKTFKKFLSFTELTYFLSVFSFNTLCKHKKPKVFKTLDHSLTSTHKKTRARGYTLKETQTLKAY